MPLPRPHTLLAAATAVLMAVPAAPPPAAAAGGAPERPPLVRAAVLPEPPRVARQRRPVRSRTLSVLLRRWRRAGAGPRPRAPGAPAGRTPRAAHARGPPHPCGRPGGRRPPRRAS